MTYHNPWLGLASYEETKGAENDHQFCGRDEETLDVVRLIDNNLFITLYGSSGIGKTSLLRAGVIPILRRKDYFPLYVRLSQEPKEISYAEAIVQKIQNSGLTQESGTTTKHPEGNNRLYLWHYFATTRFYNECREVYPVIILDQFEEVFREGDKAKAELLLKQIYLLLNDELEMPDEAGYSADTNYRFVASIREDFLFVLEDSIDANSLDLYKNNRYRLRPMKPENAREVVLIPGKDCIEESEKEAIVKRIMDLATRPQSDAIDTLLLSLVCTGTYDKKAGQKIALDDLSIWKNNPMEVYYQEAVKGLSADQVRYIQQHLILEDGSRKRIDSKEVKTALGENTYQQLTQGKNRLFALGDKGQVELLHDQLGMAIYEERKAFEEKERKKKFRRRISVIGIMVLAVAGVFMFQNHSLKQQQRQARENRLRFVAEKSITLTDKGDSYSARVLALDLLPKDIEKNPHLPEAEAALRYAFDHQSAILKGHTNAVNTVCYSFDGKYILSSSMDGTVKLWDTRSGMCLRTYTGFKKRIENVLFYQSQKRVFALSEDGIVKLLDLETGKVLKEINGYVVCSSMDNKYFALAPIEPYTAWNSYFSSRKNDRWSVWDFETLECVKEYDLNESYPVTWYPDNQNILVKSKDNEFCKLNIPTGMFVTKYQFEEKEDVFINGFAVSPLGEQIAIVFSYMDEKPGYIKVIDVEIGECLRIMHGGIWVNGLAYSPDGKLIASTSMDGLVRLWNAENGSIVNVLNGINFASACPCFSPDGKCLITSSADNTIRIWDVPQLDDTSGIVKTEGKIYSIAYHPKKEQLLISFPDSLCMYNALTKRWISTIPKQDTISRVVFSPTGNVVAACFNNGNIGLFNFSKNSWKILKNEGYPFLSFNTDGSILASSNWNDSIIYLWDVATGECIKNIQNSQKILDFAFAGNNESIFVESKDSTICNWNIEKGQSIFSWKLPFLSRLTPCTDGKYLLTCNHDQVCVWNTETGECMKILKHNSSVYAYCFSFDGKYVVTTTHDLLVNVWDRESGVCLFSKKLHQYHDVQFSQNNQHIVLCSNNEVRIIDFPPLQDLIDQTRERFKDRPLTPEERRMYYLE